MQLSGTTILITGGATGIGLALARRFVRAGSEVAICGRREAALRDAQATLPELRVRVCDLTRESERQDLVEWATRELPRLNVLVNNAGIQRRFRLTDSLPDPGEWERTREEIAINFEAPLHLCQLLIPHLRTQEGPAIVNVTSGLAFVPLAAAPVYSATKAAMRSFTLSLRHQLAGTPISVIELIPPAVNTDLGGAGLHSRGVPLDEFADAAMAGLARGDEEIAYGFSADASLASRADLDALFTRLNGPRA